MANTQAPIRPIAGQEGVPLETKTADDKQPHIEESVTFKITSRLSRSNWSDSKLLSIRGIESSDEEVYDPESSAPYFGGDAAPDDIADEYEHKHSPNQDEFRLIPHRSDKDKWKIHLPIAYWLPKYKWKAWFASDLVAAITAVVMVIPQGMGYALVAGLQPIYGLYSALIGHCLYGPFGTSGQLIVAPVAIVSLMTKESLHRYFIINDKGNHVDHSDPAVQIKMAAYGSALAFQVGVMCLVAGLCKAGILANMLAEPVIVGFTFAAAILIAISQLQFIFRFEVGGGEEVVSKLISFFRNISETHLDSVWLGLFCIVFLLIMRYWQQSKTLEGACVYVKFVPSALILVVVCTTISWSLGDSTEWDVVGELPKGLPSFLNFFAHVDTQDFWDLWVPAILITVLSFIESIAVATKFADKHDYSIDASQELIALGICNLVGCWFQIYPVSGVLSLATVVEAAGALTPLYSCMAGVGMLVISSFLLFLFESLPKPVLGSIVLVGIINLVDVHKMSEIWKVNRKDFFCMVITIMVTLFIGIDYGVALGVAASIVLFIQKAAKPHYGVLGRIPHADVIVYRNVKHHAEAQTRGDMLMIRWDASIFFANTASFKTRIRKQIGRHLSTHDYPARWCLALCFSGVNDIDYTGVEMLKSFFIELKRKEIGMSLILCKLKTQVLDVLFKHGVIDIIGKDHVLWELHEAESWWNHRLTLYTVDSPLRDESPKHKYKKRRRKRRVKKEIRRHPSASLLNASVDTEILHDTAILHDTKSLSNLANVLPFKLDVINDDMDQDDMMHYAAPHVAKLSDSGYDEDMEHSKFTEMMALNVEDDAKLSN